MNKAKINLNFTRKQWVIFAVAGLIVVVAISLVVLLIVNISNSSRSRRSVASVCTEETIKKTISYIDGNEIAKLETAAANIKQSETHRYDANCDYLLARYYLMTGNISSAEMYINEMSESTKAGSEYSTLLRSATDPVVMLRERLAGMKKQQESQRGSIDGDLLNKVDEMEDDSNQ